MLLRPPTPASPPRVAFPPPANDSLPTFLFPPSVSGCAFLLPVCLLLLVWVQADASSCAEIQRRYADHLYSKHDYDGAMTQYVSTIGYLEPSYVIRKFLDAQRIHNLTSYLEQLHEQVSSPVRTLHARLYSRTGPRHVTQEQKSRKHIWCRA